MILSTSLNFFFFFFFKVGYRVGPRVLGLYFLYFIYLRRCGGGVREQPSVSHYLQGKHTTG